MDLFFPAAALALCLLATVRSVGLGLAAVLAVGYLNGVIRANVLSVYTTFMFDAALLGLYVGTAATRGPDLARAAAGRTGTFVALLVLWPVVLAAIPVHHPLIQLVSLRSAVWFVPVVLVGLVMGRADMDLFARAVAGLNVIALAGGAYTYAFGIEGLYPHNAVTEIMYRSQDVAGYHRVPSFFLNAHQYGGTMGATLPFVLDLFLRPGGRRADRLFGAAGTGAALLGVLMCGARSPLVMTVAAAVGFWVLTGLSARVGVVLGVLLAVGGYLAATNERFQRAATVADVDDVQARVAISANEQFIDLMIDYPLGAGLGAGAPSIPYFLAEYAPPSIGMENEYSRIMLDTGWLGVGLWVGLVVWLLAVPPRFDSRRPWAIGRSLAYAQMVGCWATAFMGTGLLVSIPGTMIVFLQMSLLARGREPALFQPPGGPRRPGA